jgi:predicted nucleotidyltransferase
MLQISGLCRKYRVRTLYAFGSALTERFDSRSDVDLIADFDKESEADYFDNYFDFKYSLEEVFGRNVDLLEGVPIRNVYLRKDIERTKKLLYG